MFKKISKNCPNNDKTYTNLFKVYNAMSQTYSRFIMPCHRVNSMGITSWNITVLAGPPGIPPYCYFAWDWTKSLASRTAKIDLIGSKRNPVIRPIEKKAQMSEVMFMHLFTTRFHTWLIVQFGPQLNRIRLKAKRFCFITTVFVPGMLAQNNYIILHFPERAMLRSMPHPSFFKNKIYV